MNEIDNIKRLAGITQAGVMRPDFANELAERITSDPQGTQKVLSTLVGMQDTAQAISLVAQIVLLLERSDENSMRAFIKNTASLGGGGR